jgi:uncharacterized repeat protein (TIGR03809 family)
MHMSLHPLLPLSPSPHFGDPKTRKIVQRGAALAEQRLAYLTELFDSGRWRRFHSELEFLDNIQEAKVTLERWQAMVRGVYVAPMFRDEPAIRDAPPVQPVIAAVPRHEAEVLSFEDHAAQREIGRRPQLVAVSDVIVDHSTVREVADIREITPAVHHVSPLDLFDHDAIVARYPMLRAAAM